MLPSISQSPVIREGRRLVHIYLCTLSGEECEGEPPITPPATGENTMNYRLDCVIIGEIPN
jgi:hypothetical protein